MNGTKLFLIAGALFGTSLLCAAQISLMSFNIRYDNPADGENLWENRKFDVAALITQHTPHFLGIQEGLQHQVDFLKRELAGYDYIGVGREDGKTKGEYAAIFYQTATYQLLAQETFWLSETPEEPSKGWDAALERICTYGAFRPRKGGHTVYVFNTHFDHVGEEARLKSAELILAKIKELGIEDSVVVLTGDFNAEPKSDPITLFSTYFSGKSQAQVQPLETSPGTFNGFNTAQLPTKTIDYIFVRGLQIVSYEHITHRRQNGLWPSDHLPVLCKVERFVVRCGTKPRE